MSGWMAPIGIAAGLAFALSQMIVAEQPPEPALVVQASAPVASEPIRWRALWDEEMGAMIEVQGLKTKQDAHAFKLMPTCDRAVQFFRVYTEANHADWGKLEGATIHVIYEGLDLEGEVAGVVVADDEGHGHAAVVSLGIRPLAVIERFHAGKRRVMAELKDDDGYFDVLVNVWPMDGFDTALREASALCRLHKGTDI